MTVVKSDRELDAELAEKLFGGTPGGRWSSTGEGLLAVIEAMRERGWNAALYMHPVKDDPRWAVRMYKAPNYAITHKASSHVSFPRAVAEAALAALGSEVRGEESVSSH